MDDKFINALKTSEQLTEAKLDEGMIGKAIIQGAKNAFNKSAVGKAVNKVKNLSQQFDQEKAQKAQQQQAQVQQKAQDKINQGNQKNVKALTDIIAIQLCTDIFKSQDANENLKSVFLGFKIPKEIVNAAFKKAKEGLAGEASQKKTANDKNVGEQTASTDKKDEVAGGTDDKQ